MGRRDAGKLSGKEDVIGFKKIFLLLQGPFIRLNDFLSFRNDFFLPRNLNIEAS